MFSGLWACPRSPLIVFLLVINLAKPVWMWRRPTRLELLSAPPSMPPIPATTRRFSRPTSPWSNRLLTAGLLSALMVTGILLSSGWPDPLILWMPVLVACPRRLCRGISLQDFPLVLSACATLATTRRSLARLVNFLDVLRTSPSRLKCLLKNQWSIKDTTGIICSYCFLFFLFCVTLAFIVHFCLSGLYECSWNCSTEVLFLLLFLSCSLK
mmetsp:Transcript_20942/g.35318  ORF Transcript_20942/g.35318 Transcript_20942/m.35318 type:complete len:212 (-) Transcript_20942:34-669(-)